MDGRHRLQILTWFCNPIFKFLINQLVIYNLRDSRVHCIGSTYYTRLDTLFHNKLLPLSYSACARQSAQK